MNPQQNEIKRLIEEEREDAKAYFASIANLPKKYEVTDDWEEAGNYGAGAIIYYNTEEGEFIRLKNGIVSGKGIKPAIIRLNEDGEISYVEYCKNGKHHFRDNKPCIIEFFEDTGAQLEYFDDDGQHDEENGPYNIFIEYGVEFNLTYALDEDEFDTYAAWQHARNARDNAAELAQAQHAGL